MRYVRVLMRMGIAAYVMKNVMTCLTFYSSYFTVLKVNSLDLAQHSRWAVHLQI